MPDILIVTEGLFEYLGKKALRKIIVPGGNWGKCAGRLVERVMQQGIYSPTF